MRERLRGKKKSWLWNEKKKLLARKRFRKIHSGGKGKKITVEEKEEEKEAEREV